MDLNQEKLREVSKYVREFSGMFFDESRWTGLKISLKQRMKACSSKDIEEYLTKLKKDALEKEELVALLSVPETYFFRDKKQFEMLENIVFSNLIKEKKLGSKRPSIKMVSFGCSTGEEPYSLAISAFRKGLLKDFDVKVLGFDINKKSIEKAKRAEYMAHSFREKDTEFLKSYFLHNDGVYLVKDEVKSLVEFYTANLFDLKDVALKISGADVIFFRNVYIYFDRETSLRAFNIVKNALSKSGYLFLGFSEWLQEETGFEPEDLGKGFVWRHKGTVPSKGKALKHIDPPKDFIYTKPTKTVALKFLPGEAHYENAIGYLQIKELDKAESEFKKQLEVIPRHERSLIGLAQIFADTGKNEQALLTANKVLAVDNLSADAYFIIGLVYFNQTKMEEAANYFKKAIYSDTNHFPSSCYLAIVYKEMKRLEEANRQFRVTIGVINSLGEEGLTQEVVGLSGNYVLSVCMDSMT
jgi:chemotaxis methyl-accepting protein methylase